MRLKKLLAVLMTIAMIVCLLPATAFAANNTATTMRLAKTQGTVKVTNSTGKEVSQTENMKLYNGYKVKTGAKSYAWISLDDTKVAKVDANSCIEVQKSGKALTLFLSSGNLFFNAKQPLKGGETFNIKTSTMTTGIRGTSGCVTVVSARVTEIDLLTGRLEIVTEHPTLGLKKTAVLLAGQSATSMIDWEAMAVSGEMAEIIIDQLTADEVCGSCAIEIAADPALLERIEKEAPQLLPSLIAALAETKLAEDEAADAEKQKQIDDAANNQEFPEDVDPYFEEEAAGGGGGGGGGSSSEPEKNIVTVDGWSNENDPDAAPGLKEQLAAANNGEVDQIDLTGDVTVPANESFVVDAGNDVTLNLGTSSLTLTNTSIENNGDMTITNTEGYIIGSGLAAAVINEAGATLTMDDGMIDGQGDNGVLNYGTFTMTGGEIGNSFGGCSVENAYTGKFIMEGGTITATVQNFGEFTMNGGTIQGGNPGVINAATYEYGLKIGTFTMNGGQILGDSSQETGVANEGGKVTLNSGAVLKGLGTAAQNNNYTYAAEDGENEYTTDGVVTIAGASFDSISGRVIDNEGAVVTQKTATIQNCPNATYINNYGGTVNLYGGDIHREGMATAVENQMGTVNVYDGNYTIYGGNGIYNSNGKTTVNMEGGMFRILDGTGIHCVSGAERILNLAGGSIIAEGTAQGINADIDDTVLNVGGDFVVKAKSANRVSTIVPEGYMIDFVDEYYVLTELREGEEETENNIFTVSDAGAFKDAVTGEAVTATGGAVKLDADITLVEQVTVSAVKELNIDLNSYTLTLDATDSNIGKLINTDKLRITDSSGGGEIVINGNGNAAAIENSGELAIVETEISGASDVLIENSGKLTMDKDSSMSVVQAGGYGIYNTGELILNLGSSDIDILKVDAEEGVGIYSGNTTYLGQSSGKNAELTFVSGEILLYGGATAMKFDGGTVHLDGGEIAAGYIDGTYNYAIVDKTAGASAVSGEVKTIITAYAGSWEYVDGEYILASKPRDVVKCVYDGILPEGYYVKYIPTDDEFKLQAYQDLKNLLVDVYRYTGVPNQAYIDNDYVYDDLVLDFTEELKLAEDMTIDLAAVKKYLTVPEYDYVFSTLPMVSVESTTGTLLIDLMGHTLTLDVPIEVYGNLKIVDSVGGGKIVTSLEEPFILDGTYVQEEHPDVTNNLTVDESLIEKVQEEPVDEPAEESLEEPAEEPVEEPVDEPIDEPVDEPAEELVEEPAEEPVDEPTEEPVDEPAEELTEEPVDEPAEEPVDEPTDEPANEPIEEPEEESVDEQQENETEEQEPVSVEDGGESVPVE